MLSDWGEWIARQAYWRAPRLGERLRRRPRRSGAVAEASRVADRLREVIPHNGVPCLVHSSLDGVALRPDDAARTTEARPMEGLPLALWLLGAFREAAGPDATLCMPTHPQLEGDPGFLFDKSETHYVYDVRRSPSRVGLLSELFRRRRGVRRSHHPLSALAACGPIAELLVKEELPADASAPPPLPHGRHSSYHRLCQRGAVVVGFNLRLIKAMTVLHVAEEVADERWPVRDFFYRRRFTIVDADSHEREVTVRERRPEYVRSLMLGRVERDLLRHGILRRNDVQGIRIEWADAGEVMRFMTDQQQCGSTRTYPYVWPAAAALARPTAARSTAARSTAARPTAA